MSICICPVQDRGGIKSPQQKALVESFLRNIGAPEHIQWSLLDLKTMAEAGNSLEEIQTVVPFRGGPCSRTTHCCSVCTRRCKQRCIQDCLTRLSMWKQTVESTPESERERLPLNIRMIAVQKFETLEELSWAVGEIVSKYTNPALKEYQHADNPYKLNYEPSIEVDANGKKRSNPISGEYLIIRWPQSGLCPFCLPNATVNGYTIREQRKAERRGSTVLPGKL